MVLFSAVENDVYFASLKELLNGAKHDAQLFKVIVNTPFSDRRRATLLGLGVVTLAILNKKTRTIDRVAHSDTDLSAAAFRMSIKPFKEIRTPINYKGNFVTDAIKSERYQQTSDWQYLYAPDLTPEEARINQAAAGIGCSFVYPLIGFNPGGALIFSYYLPLDKIESEHHAFMRSYSRLAANILKSR